MRGASLATTDIIEEPLAYALPTLDLSCRQVFAAGRRPRSVLVQLGLGSGDMAVPQNHIVSKEIEVRGSFRFHEEFALAAKLVNRRRVDVRPFPEVLEFLRSRIPIPRRRLITLVERKRAYCNENLRSGGSRPIVMITTFTP